MGPFAALGLPPALHPFQTPTPIQTCVIPSILAGRDVVGVAETGSGKTAAYGLPLLHRLKQPAGSSPRALILTPTRELTLQVGERMGRFAEPLSLRVRTATGGVEIRPQLRTLEAGLDVLVATPGRLLDLHRRKALDLSAIVLLVLDEADQLLDQGFRDDLFTIAEAVGSRQTLLFSATLSSTLDRLVEALLTDPQIERLDDRPPSQLVQRVYYVSANDRQALLCHLLDDPGIERALIFTRTRKAADLTAERLSATGHPAIALHADKSQSVRNATLTSFASGDARILVATDVAARGLDLPSISHVINLGMPHDATTYVHRIGRTARAGRGGFALSLCVPEDGGRLRDVERLTGLPLAPVLDHPWTDFSAIPDPRATAEKAEPAKKKKKRRRR